MSYAASRDSISHAPVTLLVLTLDCCSRSFGVDPCAATGEPCYNTYHTCKYRQAYQRTTRDYEFTSSDVAPPWSGVRPYLKSVKYFPTEIRDNLTSNGKITAELLDEPDTDVGIDPYLTQRSSVQGTFWKKLLARNPNYKTRAAKVYEGFSGMTREEFLANQRGVGTIDAVQVTKNGVRIDIADPLKELNKIDVPPKVDVKTLLAVTAADTVIPLATGVDNAVLVSPGWVRIDDELISYTTYDAVQVRLTGCVRGYDGTAAVEHSEGSRVQPCRHYPQGNPFDRIKTMLLTDGALDSSAVNIAAIDGERDWPGGDIDLPAVTLDEPEKLDKLLFELIDLVDCKMWVGEDLQVTLRRNMPNRPGRSYRYLSDEANIVRGSVAVDLNPDSRISRIILYWDQRPCTKADDPQSYRRWSIFTDLESSGVNLYNEVSDKYGPGQRRQGPSRDAADVGGVYCRWLRPDYIMEELLDGWIRSSMLRVLTRARDPQPIVTLEVTLKDEEIKTGDWVMLSTAALQNPDGTPIERIPFQVIYRDRKDRGKLQLKLLQVSRRGFFMFAPDEITAGYSAATDAEREHGFWGDDNDRMPDTFAEAYHFF